MEAESAEAVRCHLHKKANKACKKCQRYQELLNKEKEDKAALRDKFVASVRKKAMGEEKAVPEDMQRSLEIANPKSFGMPPLMQAHIVQSKHFQTLMEIDTFEEIVDEIYQWADGVEPYLSVLANCGSVPSALMVCTYRLLTLGITGRQLQKLLESEQSVYTRCAGFLFVRFGLAPDQLWNWIGEYVLDDENFKVNKGNESSTTIGEFVEGLLVDDRYFDVVLPRLPVSAKKRMDAHLAHVPQYRKRAQANKKLLDVYRQRGVQIEICLRDGEWQAAETLGFVQGSSRPMVRVKLEDKDSTEVMVHLGKVILADSRHQRGSGSDHVGGRGRSRSRSPTDWAREKGKAKEELLDELRKAQQDRVMSSSKKDYAKRPVSFQVALPMEQGSASQRLHQDESSATARPRRGNERERSPEPVAKKEHSVEYQQRMKKIFETYGMAKGAQETKHNDIDTPDVMRLG